ncbi:MAG: antitoxin Xre/MbcA/ParS toxin-binding domain-containing protein [Bosea sp. (in: a-proteobacteria)]
MSAVLPLTAAAFREADQPYLSARRVAEKLGLPLTEIAAMIGVARTTLTARSGMRKVDAALSPLVRIIAMAAEMAGGDDRAAIWFKHQPLPGWGGKTALDLVRSGQSDQVLDYLESVRAGVYS